MEPLSGGFSNKHHIEYAQGFDFSFARENTRGNFEPKQTVDLFEVNDMIKKLVRDLKMYPAKTLPLQKPSLYSKGVFWLQ